MKHLLGRLLVALALLAASPSGAWAAEYPERDVALVVAFSPKTVSDVLARQIAADLGETLGRKVVVDNKPGVGGYVAWRQVSDAPPDGYTILLAENALAINTAVQPQRDFEPTAAFAPVAGVAVAPLALIVNPDVGVDTLEDLVALSKKRPDALIYSSSGAGSVSHVTFEALKAATGLKAVHQPFRGTDDAIGALVANKAQLALTFVGRARKLAENGEAVVLALSGHARSPNLPDVPTLEELGVAGDMAPGYWWGLFMPVGAPDLAKAKIAAALRLTLAKEDVARRLADLDYTPAFTSAEDLAALLADEMAFWTAFVRDHAIKPE